MPSPGKEFQLARLTHFCDNGGLLYSSGLLFGFVSKLKDLFTAPVVSDIFLAHVDRALERDLEGLALRMFRYVDDYLFFCEDYNPTRKMVDIKKAFKQRSFGLTSCKPLTDRAIQFMDVIKVWA